MTYIVIIYQTILIVFLSIFIFRSRKLLKQKKNQNQNIISKKNEDFLIKPSIKHIGKERRNNARLSTPDIRCIVKFISFEDEKLKKLINKQFYGNLENISVGGLKFNCEYNVPVREKVIVQVSFNLMDYNYSLKAEVVRKEEILVIKEYCYGLRFIEIDIPQEKLLLKTINNLIIENKRKSLK